jgi:hypothetical protein
MPSAVSETEHGAVDRLQGVDITPAEWVRLLSPERIGDPQLVEIDIGEESVEIVSQPLGSGPRCSGLTESSRLLQFSGHAVDGIQLGSQAFRLVADRVGDIGGDHTRRKACLSAMNAGQSGASSGPRLLGGKVQHGRHLQERLVHRPFGRQEQRGRDREGGEEEVLSRLFLGELPVEIDGELAVGQLCSR